MKIQLIGNNYNVVVNGMAENYISWRNKYAEAIDQLRSRYIGNDDIALVFNVFLASSAIEQEELVVAASAVYGEVISYNTARNIHVTTIEGRYSNRDAARIALKIESPLLEVVSDDDVCEAHASGLKFDTAIANGKTFVFKV